MNTRYYRLLTPLYVLMAILMAACSSDVATDDEAPLPEGMGRIRITICTPEDNPNLTRAVNATPWEAPDHEWERLQTFRILICKASTTEEGQYEVVQAINGDKDDMTAVSGTSYPYKQSAVIESGNLTAGSYQIFALANFANYSDYDEGDTFDPNATITFYNGYSATGTTKFGDANPIPMTGKLASPVVVSAGEIKNAGTITVWRVIGKMQFYFTNEATEQIQIMGVEVDPINTNAIVQGVDYPGQGLVYLFSKDDLTSTDNLAVSGVSLPDDVNTAPVSYEISAETPLLTLADYTGSGDKPTGTLFFYVNETNGTFTTTQNEISLRFKIRRGDATEDELRYGLTTRYGDGSTGQDGFNVIRRNDWIHIPIVLTDWQYRVEPLAFVPIAGYPAETVSSDGLTATYKTGGMIALQPFIRKKTATGYTTWLDFDNPEVTFVSLSWKNSDGDNIAYYNSDGTVKDGDTSDPTDKKIVNTAFAYDPVTKCIIGELNNDLTSGSYKTTITINVDLGAEPLLYHYTFSCNVILQ